MIEKREPLLADKFLATTYGRKGLFDILPRDYYETARSNLLLSKRFVLTEQAAKYCAELLKEAPRIVADAQDFAIPPFERTYIEIPYRVWYETISDSLSDIETGDRRIGYIIVKSEVRILVESKDDVVLLPIAYHLNQPLSVAQEVELVKKLGTSRIQLDLFYWGGSATSFGTSYVEDGKRRVKIDEWQKEGLRSLRANHSFSFNLHKSHQTQMAKMWDSFFNGSSGDLRNIIGLLIFLNRTPKLRYEREEPFQSRMIHRKPVSLLKHRVITLHVNPVPRLLKLAAGDGIRRRLHDVKGHLCHNEIARTNNHDHDWIESKENHLHWFCECGAVRWWRKEHKRGSEEQGIVTSSYKVEE